MENTEYKLPLCVSPDDQELIECVIKAACRHFEISEQQLIGENKLANIRHLCFYIIYNGTHGVYDYAIGQFFKKKRTAVQYGIDLIEHQKNIYRQTLGNLNSITAIANNFEKKYSWHLPTINITP
ncbi:hypothetical protein [Pinibacter soli]|uniref:Chromosomal replication initiator DnaA C-terminal domain-containing protein n=1 Tax=Pinibacter soli TaxID=3044211 RepID=A0ABT6RC00_9BACT|nr:hypothetical protein [Pinibacter soli]MDI3319981.1 hypothetical protein [Pinibacter soli]